MKRSSFLVLGLGVLIGAGMWAPGCGSSSGGGGNPGLDSGVEGGVKKDTGALDSAKDATLGTGGAPGHGGTPGVDGLTGTGGSTGIDAFVGAGGTTGLGGTAGLGGTTGIGGATGTGGGPAVDGSHDSFVPHDGSADQAKPDGPADAPNTGIEVGPDAKDVKGVDGTSIPVDSHLDSGVDAGVDAAIDSGADAAPGVDASPVDSVVDGGFDLGIDV